VLRELRIASALLGALRALGREPPRGQRIYFWPRDLERWGRFLAVLKLRYRIVGERRRKLVVVLDSVTASLLREMWEGRREPFYRWVVVGWCAPRRGSALDLDALPCSRRTVYRGLDLAKRLGLEPPRKRFAWWWANRWIGAMVRKFVVARFCRDGWPDVDARATDAAYEWIAERLGEGALWVRNVAIIVAVERIRGICFGEA